MKNTKLNNTAVSSKKVTSETDETSINKGNSEINSEYQLGKPSKKFIILYGLAFFGAWCALIAPTSVSLQFRIAQIDPNNKAQSLAVVLGVGAIFALISNPIWGRFSDISTSKYGRRKPYILLGALVSTALLLILPLAQNIVFLVILWSLVQVFYNAAIAAMYALIADQIAENYRGIVTAATGIGGSVGMLFGIAIASMLNTNPFLMFALPALMGAILVAIFAITLKEVPLTKSATVQNLGDAQGVQTKKLSIITEILKSFSFNPVKNPNFTKILITRFLLFTGISSVTNYQIYYMQDKLGWSAEVVSQMVIYAYAVAIICGILGNGCVGVLTDKLGKTKVFIISFGLLLAGATFLLAFTTEMWMLILVVAVVGTAQGVITTVSYVASTLVLPDKTQSGKWLGIVNISATLPQSVAPALASMFLCIQGPNNYTSLYICTTVIVLIGVVCAWTTKKIS
jgi:MFS family permease